MPFKCEMCDAVLKSKFSLEAFAWDWFTGYLGATNHFCSKHRHSREHDDLLVLSQKPGAAPKETP